MDLLDLVYFLGRFPWVGYLVYIYDLSRVDILVSSLPLVFLFDLGPAPLFTFPSFPFNTVNFLVAVTVSFHVLAHYSHQS